MLEARMRGGQSGQDLTGMLLRVSEARQRAEERKQARIGKQFDYVGDVLSSLDARLQMDDDQENALIGQYTAYGQALGIEAVVPDPIPEGIARSIEEFQTNPVYRRLQPEVLMGLLVGRYGKHAIRYVEQARAMALEAQGQLTGEAEEGGAKAGPPGEPESKDAIAARTAQEELGGAAPTGGERSMATYARELFGETYDPPEGPKPLSVNDILDLMELNPSDLPAEMPAAIAKALGHSEQVVGEIMGAVGEREAETARKFAVGAMVAEIASTIAGDETLTARDAQRKIAKIAKTRGIQMTPEEVANTAKTAVFVHEQQREQTRVGLSERAQTLAERKEGRIASEAAEEGAGEGKPKAPTQSQIVTAFHKADAYASLFEPGIDKESGRATGPNIWAQMSGAARRARRKEIEQTFYMLWLGNREAPYRLNGLPTGLQWKDVPRNEMLRFFKGGEEWSPGKSLDIDRSGQSEEERKRQLAIRTGAEELP